MLPRTLILAPLAAVAVLLAPMARAQAPAVTPLPPVQMRGTGPVQMILIPGWTCDSSVWDAFMARNADKYTMHAVTLNGFGATPALPLTPGAGATPWLDNGVAAVAKYIQDKGLKNPVVVGHFIGGVLAMRLGIEHPDLVSRIVTIEGFPAYPLQESPMSQQQRNDAVDKAVAPQLTAMNDADWTTSQKMKMESMVMDQARAVELAAISAKTPRPTAIEYLLEVFRTDLTPKLGGLQIPLLAIAALDDGGNQAITDWTRQVWSAEMRGAPKGQLVFFENTRHFVMDDQPAALDKAIAAFIAGRGVEGLQAPGNGAPPPSTGAPSPAPPAQPAATPPAAPKPPAPGGEKQPK